MKNYKKSDVTKKRILSLLLTDLGSEEDHPDDVKKVIRMYCEALKRFVGNHGERGLLEASSRDIDYFLYRLSATLAGVAPFFPREQEPALRLAEKIVAIKAIALLRPASDASFLASEI